jgi:DNA-binding beta-propeller fold protein YncE
MALVSCEVAPIEAPPPDDAESTFAVVADWPKLPAEREIGRVLGVAVAPDGRIWVAHTANGEARNETPISGATLAVLDPATGEIIEELGAGLFRLPHAIAFDAEGLLWVTDADANRIFVLEAGNIVRTIGVD